MKNFDNFKLLIIISKNNFNETKHYKIEHLFKDKDKNRNNLLVKIYYILKNYITYINLYWLLNTKFR